MFVGEGDPLGAGLGLEDLAQLGLQLAVVAGVVGVLAAGPPLEQVHAADALAEVLPERLFRGHEEHVAVGGLVQLVAHAFAHAGRSRCPPLVVVGRVAGDLGLRPFVGAPGLRAIPVERGGGIGLCDLHPAALARLPGAQHAGEDAERAVQRPGVDTDRDVLRHVAEAVVVVGRCDDAGPRVEGDAVTRQVLVGAGHAVAGDRAEHDREDSPRAVARSRGRAWRARPVAWPRPPRRRWRPDRGRLACLRRSSGRARCCACRG